MARWALETKRVRHPEWDEDEWVEIKKLSGYERDRMNAALVRVTATMSALDRGAEDIPAEFDWGEANFWILKMGIRAWHLKGPDGTPVPLNDTWLKRLDPRDQDWLVSQIREFNRPPEESFPPEGEGSAEGSDGGDVSA